VPLHLRNAPTRLMKRMGHGQGYVHAHEHPGAVADMTCLPEGLVGRRFYEPSDRGRERVFREYLDWVEQKRLEQRKAGPSA
jgi:putative ATPase